MTKSSKITTERIGRRTYLRGDTFSAKETIKAEGGHWDGDQRAWWLGDHAKAQALADRLNAMPVEAKATASYRKLADGSWGVRGKNMVVGGSVTVFKKSGERKTEKVKAILSTDADGWQVASIEQSSGQSSGQYSNYRGGYGGRSGGRRRHWTPCGYPGCSPHYCDECDGEGGRY